MDSFYLTLPSTASHDIYPHNSQTDFTVRLAQPVHLYGKWKVGLAEVHIPVSWYNIDGSNDTYHYYAPALPEEYRKIKLQAGKINREELLAHLSTLVPKEIMVSHTGGQWVFKPSEGYGIMFPKSSVIKLLCVGGGEIDKPIHHRFASNLCNAATFEIDDDCYFYVIPPSAFYERKVPHGRYETVESLFDAMNHVLPYKTRKAFRFNQLANHTMTIAADKLHFIKFPLSNPGLGEMLGFTKFDFPMTKSVGDYPIDMNRGIYGIYIYSDLIAPQLLGDTHGELLRVVNPAVRTSNNEAIVAVYQQPDYYPLARNSFESVRISLRTDSGEPLHFKFGKVLIKLHFCHEG